MSKVQKLEYEQMDSYSLMLVCIGSILVKNEDCTFERLVYECFTNFPKTFSLFRYPQWPDSNKLDRPLRKLREKGLVVGGHKTGFALTEDGKYQASLIKKALQQHIKLKPSPRILKGKERKLVAYIASSELYEKFRNDKENFTTDRNEIVDFLRATLETPEDILKQNLAQYKKLIEQLHIKEIEDFLNVCDQELKSLIDTA